MERLREAKRNAVSNLSPVQSLTEEWFITVVSKLNAVWNRSPEKNFRSEPQAPTNRGVTAPVLYTTLVAFTKYPLPCWDVPLSEKLYHAVGVPASDTKPVVSVA